jgi:hypothetical protein
MDPSLIMSEDEKRQRFKNYFKKKDEEEMRKQELRKREAASTRPKNRAYLRPILPK